MVYESQAYTMDHKGDRIAKHIYVSDPLKTQNLYSLLNNSFFKFINNY